MESSVGGIYDRLRCPATPTLTLDRFLEGSCAIHAADWGVVARLSDHRKPDLRILRIALLALLLGSGACNRPAPPDVTASTTPAPAAPVTGAALVGQWRNTDGTWRFQANGNFWFMGGITIQANPRSVADLPKTEVLQGTYQVREGMLHLTLKQGTPSERESAVQIEGRTLTIGGKVYEQQ